MANNNKRDFASSLLGIENEVIESKKESELPKTEIAEEVENEKSSEIVVSKEIPENLTSMILSKVSEIETEIFNENNKTSFKKGAVKVKYSDKYRAATVSIRPTVRKLLDYLYEQSNLNKAEILELVILNGLKNTNFDE